MPKVKKIPVSKALPTKSGIYSAFTDESVNVKAIYNLERKRWYGLISEKNITKLVTHWVEHAKYR